MLVCSFVCANGTRDRGCSKHPVFPAPSNEEGGKIRQTSGVSRRENAQARSAVIASSEATKRSIYPRAGTSLCCARNDGDRDSLSVPVSSESPKPSALGSPRPQAARGTLTPPTI